MYVYKLKNLADMYQSGQGEGDPYWHIPAVYRNVGSKVQKEISVLWAEDSIVFPQKGEGS